MIQKVKCVQYQCTKHVVGNSRKWRKTSAVVLKNDCFQID